MPLIYLFIAALCLNLSVQAIAQTPPVPPSHKERLERLNQNLHKEENKKQALEQDVKTLRSDLKNTKDKMVRLGGSIQSHEKKRAHLEQRIKNKTAEKRIIETALKKEHKLIGNLVLALQRIARIPPETLALKPGAPLKTAQSAMLMSTILPSLYKDAQNLKNQIAALDKLTLELKEEKIALDRTTQALGQEHQKLETLSQKRQALFEQTAQNLKQNKARVNEISTQAQNLGDLVEKLEQDKKRQAAREQTERAVLANLKRALPSPVTKTAPLQTLVSGHITLQYNEKNPFGAPSQGIEISTAPGALVIAPMAGTVRFAGPFKNYRSLVIIEHNNGYHSLIAGLGRIDTNVGAQLSANEPVGRLDFSSEQGKTVLYYELRHKGKPINPAKKLKGLS